MSIQIPFGWHVEEKRFKDPHQVPNGDKCGCICAECKQPLQAGQGSVREYYFRHKNLSSCTGNLESLMHRVAKQIISDHHDLLDGDSVNFHYDLATPEKRKHGKQPDIYLKDLQNGRNLIVEIFYSHRTEADTLQAYWNNSERVLEIDISCTRYSMSSYEALTDLMLRDAPRRFLIQEDFRDWQSPSLSSRYDSTQEASETSAIKDRANQILGVIAAGIVLVGAALYFLFRKRKE